MSCPIKRGWNGLTARLGGILLSGLFISTLLACAPPAPPAPTGRTTLPYPKAETYRNSRHGYAFRYPVTLTLDAMDSDAASVRLTNYEEASLTEAQVKNPFWPGKLVMEFTVLKEEDPNALREEGLLAWSETRPRYARDRVIEEIEPLHKTTLTDSEATAYTMLVSGGQEAKGLVKGWYVLLPKGEVLTITTLIVPPDDPALLGQLDGVLSTLTIE